MFTSKPSARLGLILSAAIFSSLFLGCGGGSTPPGPVTPPTPSAPTISAHPQSQVVTEGDAVTLGIQASGSGTLTYQWKKGGVDLAGKTGATLAFNPVSLTDAGSYSVAVTNTANQASATVTSSAATLTVNARPTATAPVLSAQPQSQSVLEGGRADFSVTAAANGTLTYQWRKDGHDLVGRTGSGFSINPAAASDAGTYTVRVTNTLNGTSASTTSAEAVLIVASDAVPPTITTEPQDKVVVEGQTAQFTVEVSGTAPFTYQWSKGATAIPNSNASTLTLSNVSQVEAGTYSARVSNAKGYATTRAATLTVNPAASTPSISTQPAGGTYLEGQSASLGVVATGNGTLSYQWRKGGVDLAGKTGANLSLNPVATTDAGSYTVLITNSLNGTTATKLSDPAVLVVNPTATAPVITTQPKDATASVGESVALSVAATGNGVLSYQWYKGGAVLNGATSASLVFNPVALADAGTFSVEVTNSLNGTTSKTTSAIVTLSVTPSSGPSILAQPKSATVTAPDGATFSVSAIGSDLTYAWKKNGTVIGGATTAEYTVAATDLHAVADQYSVTVTANGVSVTSDSATLTVVAPKPVYAGDPTVADASRVYTVVPSWYTTAPSDATGSFRVGYDTGLLNPVWSSACFFTSAPWTLTRPSTYPTDTRITGSLSTEDYTGTGYSRSHMTGFADLRDVYGADAGKSTMYMSNMAPMVQNLNGGVWGNLETLLTQTLPASFGRTWSYTGPIFAGQLVSPVGAKNIPIPTAWYKIVVRETAPGNPKVLAMIVPHSTTVSSGTTAAVSMKTTDFWKFVTTLERVQNLTGLTFFPSLSTVPSSFSTTVDVTGWASGLEQGPNKPNVHMIQPSWDSTFTHVHNTTNAVTTITLSNGNVGEQVPFEAQVTPDPDPIASTAWDFGDNTTDTVNLKTTHAYSAAGNYTVTFSAVDSSGHTSAVSRIVSIRSLDPNAPVISTQPQGKAANEGTDVTFSVVATGNGTLTYQWRKDGVELAGKTGSSLMLSSVTTADAGAYSVVVTNTLNGQSQSTISSDAMLTVNQVSAHDMTEGFETGTKGSYNSAPNTVSLGTGTWILYDAMLAKSTTNGGSASDHFNGLQGVRMRNAAAAPSGRLGMVFDWPYGAQSVSLSIAQYSTDAANCGTVGMWYSTDAGSTWTQLPGTVQPTSTTPTTYSWAVGVTGSIRFELRRTDSISNGRLCLDDFKIVGY